MATLIRKEQKVTAEDCSTAEEANDLVTSVPTSFPRVERVAADARTEPAPTNPVQVTVASIENHIQDGATTSFHEQVSRAVLDARVLPLTLV